MDSAEGNTLSNHEEDQVFEVENILDMREMNGEKQYLIKWKNYDDRCRVWIFRKQL
ncbi:hypothetical protein BX666DRAFT_1951693 [Dichotomocladium elegans]|nr:hypothetical protein BX666DRAFT_1951693 [Dichotomocladium elegans]